MTQTQTLAEARTVFTLGVDQPGRTRMFSYSEGPLLERQFRVETRYSGLAAGAELSLLKGEHPTLHACWDSDQGVFRPGRAGQRLPVPFLGHMEVARVVESRVAEVRPDTLLAMSYGHRTGHTAQAGDLYVPLPEDLPELLGIFVARTGPACANGLLHAAAELHGRHARTLADGVRDRAVLIVGAGALGLLLGLWARELGAAEVAVADRTPQRLAAAQALGLAALDEREGDVWQQCKQRWWHGPNDRGADVAFQCRGQTAALATALRCLRPQGSVIDLACYSGGAPDLYLGEEFHHNGLSIRAAPVGQVPRVFGWDAARLALETVQFLWSCGAEIQQHLITDIVPFEQAPGFIDDVIARRRHTIQAVFSF
jgi:NADPH:quinone reductase-like Zn-dependent oxidoreductase